MSFYDDTDSFAIIDHSVDLCEDELSITDDIDLFLKNTMPSYLIQRYSKSLLDLPTHLLNLIASFLDVESTVNLMLSNSVMISPCRRRIYHRIVVVEEFDISDLRNETIVPSTIISKEKLVDCLDMIRLGDDKICKYVEEIVCFVEFDWGGEAFGINDAWYLTAPILTNLRKLIWPKLPLIKFQSIGLETRYNLQSLCLGFTDLKEQDLKSCDNNVLRFPKLQELVINLDKNEKMDQIDLFARLLLYGDLLENVTRLKISGSLTRVISPNNKRLKSIIPSPRTPTKQILIHEDQSPDRSRRISLKSIRSNFKSQRSSSVTSPTVKSQKSSQLFPSPTGEIFASSAFETKPLPLPNDSYNAHNWVKVFSLFTQRLRLTTLVLDKIVLTQADLNVLRKAVSIQDIQELELSNVLVYYDEQDENTLTELPLLSLGSKLLKLTSLSLDVMFECNKCGYDCHRYGVHQVEQFLNSIPPLQKLGIVTHGDFSVTSESLFHHTTSLQQLAISEPDKLTFFVKILEENLKLNNHLWDRQGELSRSLRRHFKNNVNNTVLLNNVLTPNISSIVLYNTHKNRLFNRYKYQLLNLIGGKLDEFDSSFPNLEEISFNGVKFRTN